MTAETTEQIAGVVESIATVLALICAGIWTYLLFVRHRERFPRAEITHTITSLKLSDENTLLRIELKVSNKGKVLLLLHNGCVRLQQLAPCPDHVLEWLSACQASEGAEYKSEADWPLIANRKFWDAKHELEPSESESLYFDFLLTPDIESVFVYSYVQNVEKSKGGREIGWNTTSRYDLVPSQVPPKPPPEGPPWADAEGR